MGSSSSSRTITVERDAETGVVKVSEDLLSRMLNTEDKASEPAHDRIPDRDLWEHPSPNLTDINLKHINDEWEARLHDTEQQWQEKLNEVAKKNDALLQLSSEKFKQAAEEVEAKYIKRQSVPVCQKLEDEVLSCYANNPGKALNCSQQVKAFNNCVGQCRTSILTKKSLVAAS